MGLNHESIEFSRDDLIPFLAFVSSQASSRFPEPGYLMTSDVAWRLPFSVPEKQIQLWKRGKSIIGYAWTTPNDIAVLDTSEPELLPELMVHAADRTRHDNPTNPWLLSIKNMEEWQHALETGLHLKRADQRLLQTTAFDRDRARQTLLIDHGFKATEHTAKHLMINIDALDEPPLTEDGIVFRSVRRDELDKRVQLHRDAWTGSTFSLESYERVRESPVFNAELDIVSVEPDGAFGSYCIGWVDTQMKTGSFEPVGTHKDFRSRGLARNVIRECLWRMKQAGMATAKISTAGFNQPAFDLYQKCGFELTDIERTYVKSID